MVTVFKLGAKSQFTCASEFLKKNYLFYFWLCQVLAAAWAFLQLWGAGTPLQLWCPGLSAWWLLLLQSPGSGVLAAVRGLSSLGPSALEHSCGAQAQWLCSSWDLPRPGIKPVSPALAGRFFATEPPGKPPMLLNLKHSHLKHLISFHSPGPIRSFTTSSQQLQLQLHSPGTAFTPWS